MLASTIQFPNNNPHTPHQKKHYGFNRVSSMQTPSKQQPSTHTKTPKDSLVCGWPVVSGPNNVSSPPIHSPARLAFLTLTSHRNGWSWLY
jgi:hypothetical protein